MKWLIGSLKSKTMHFFAWVGVMVPVLSEWLPQVQATLPQLQPYIPDHLYKAGFIVCIVGGLVLRLVTTTSVPDK